MTARLDLLEQDMAQVEGAVEQVTTPGQPRSEKTPPLPDAEAGVHTGFQKAIQAVPAGLRKSFFMALLNKQ